MSSSNMEPEYCPVRTITLLYSCLDCRGVSAQPLSVLAQNGTHTCECGADMVLQENVEINKDD